MNLIFPNVDASVVGVWLQVWGHLGRNVIWRPAEGGGGDAVEDTFLAHPKVCQLTVAVCIQQDVVQLQVPAEQEDNVRVHQQQAFGFNAQTDYLYKMFQYIGSELLCN